MYYIMLFNFFMFMIGMLMLFLNFMLSKKKNKNLNKITTFECGFDNVSMLRLPFSLQFYMISIIFLIFDVEISLIFPIVKTFNLKNFDNVFIFIILILILGLYYEWKEGSLEWLK
uniref:NADH-ubiquinone oxidoreductase chain 3 n=1 Tax=Figites sp. ZJUH 20220009 TaxID=2995276 RepID=A0A9E8G7D8_9HYME|nr:NADH dehydrogenase subunit 3 [Figites sp. ZJUH 20220009]